MACTRRLLWIRPRGSKSVVLSTVESEARLGRQLVLTTRYLPLLVYLSSLEVVLVSVPAWCCILDPCSVFEKVNLDLKLRCSGRGNNLDSSFTLLFLQEASKNRYQQLGNDKEVSQHSILACAFSVCKQTMIPRVSGEGNSTSLSAPTTSTTTPTDNDNNNTIMQPHQQANDLYGQSSSSSYGGGGGSSSRLSSRGPHQQPPAGSSTRRFTISAGPEMILNDSSTSASQQQQQHQVPMHGGAGLPTSGSGNNDLLGVSHSQRGSQQHSFNGRGGSLGTGDDLQQQQQQSTTSPGNNNNNNSYYGSNNEPLSPTHLAHRMSLGFYPMSGGSTGSHNNFGGGLDPLDLSGRGGPGGVGGGPPAMGNGVPLTQADREEELLLNLLIARRQRGRVAGGDGKRGSQSSLADDLLRLRQNRASLMTTSSSTGGGGGASSSSSSSQQQSNYHGYNQHQQPHHQQQSHHHQQQQMQHHSSSSSRGGGGGGGMPQLPGMPPLYADILPGTGVSSNMYPGSGMDVYHSGSGSGGGGGGRMSAKSEGAGGSLSSHQRQQMRQIQDVAERIDRSPGRFHISDARMSEMRELSERGFKRGLGSMGMGSGNMGGMGGHLSSSGMGMGMGMGGGGGFDSGVGSGAFSYTPNMEDMGPPTKKKRTHKKKPADMVRSVKLFPARAR